MKIEDYNKYYIQGSDHYLIPKDEFKELFNEMINWKEESQKLQTTANNCKRLKDNWNKLKEYIEHQIQESLGGREFCCYSNVNDKMKELEESLNDEIKISELPEGMII